MHSFFIHAGANYNEAMDKMPLMRNDRNLWDQDHQEKS